MRPRHAKLDLHKRHHSDQTWKSTNGYKREHSAISDGWIGFGGGGGWRGKVGGGLRTRMDRWSPRRTDTHTEHTSQTSSRHTRLRKSLWSQGPGDVVQTLCSWTETYGRYGMTHAGRKVGKTGWGGKKGLGFKATNSKSRRLRFTSGECELCDRKSPGFVRIAVTAGWYCKNTHHQRNTSCALRLCGSSDKKTSASKCQTRLSPDRVLWTYSVALMVHMKPLQRFEPAVPSASSPLW